jgi:ABC-type nitrate/sulfonate/bicarbonate transport system permease component
LGKLIYNASIIFDTATVIAGIICIGTIGYTLNKLISKLENKIIHWKGY